MSSKVTINQSGGVRAIGMILIIAGIFMILAGTGVYVMVRQQLVAEDIVVAEDASFMPGWQVQGPLSAYAEANVINQHALDMADGKTYAELDREDPLRETVMNASFLRTSLFTSVVAFGVSILVAGLGILNVLVGWALRRTASGPQIVVESIDDNPASAPARVSAAPVEPALPIGGTRSPGRASAAPDAGTSDTPEPSALTAALGRHTQPVPPIVAASAGAAAGAAGTAAPVAPAAPAAETIPVHGLPAEAVEQAAEPTEAVGSPWERAAEPEVLVADAEPEAAWQSPSERIDEPASPVASGAESADAGDSDTEEPEETNPRI